MSDEHLEGVTEEMLLEWYRRMATIRRTEELAAKAYTLRKIIGFCHLYIGQEAVAVGASAALHPSDVVVASYREHGQIMARGVGPEPVFAELFAKETGMTNGVGGSMHMVDKDVNFWGGYGIVGGHVPLAAGAAFANKYRGNDGVSLVYFGDGATQQGAFFESLALAQLWKLPCIFLIENNFYAMGTSLDRQSYLTDLSHRADGVGMKRWQFHGFDVCEVYQNVKRAVEHARQGKGPVLLEAITYRYRGHSMSDPAKYRAKGELEEKKKHDALLLAEQYLTDHFGVDAQVFVDMKAEIKQQCKEAYANADKAPLSDASRLYDYVYAPTDDGGA